MNERDIAYWAGYFDADGHVTGQVRIRKSGRQAGQREISFRVGVTGNVLARLEELKALFGGSICTIKRKGDQWKPGAPVSTCSTYQWAAVHAAGDKFMRAILPYLRTKRPQAETYLKARSTFLPRGGRAKELPEETWTARLNLLNCIRQLNRPGSPDLAF